MVMYAETSIFLCFTLFVAYLICKTFAAKTEKYHQNIVSLSSGILIAVVFLEIFPRIAEGAILHGNILYLFVLASFMIYHVAEKYIYVHAKDLRERKKDLKSFHIVGFFIDNFILGLFLAMVTITASTTIVTVVFLTICLSIVANSLLLTHIEEKATISNWWTLVLSSAILFGGIAGTFMELARINGIYLLAVTSGFLLYFTVRDAMPQGRQAKPIFFGIGILCVSILFLVSGII